MAMYFFLMLVVGIAEFWLLSCLVALFKGDLWDKRVCIISLFLLGLAIASQIAVSPYGKPFPQNGWYIDTAQGWLANSLILLIIVAVAQTFKSGKATCFARVGKIIGMGSDAVGTVIENLSAVKDACKPGPQTPLKSASPPKSAPVSRADKEVSETTGVLIVVFALALLFGCMAWIANHPPKSKTGTQTGTPTIVSSATPAAPVTKLKPSSTTSRARLKSAEDSIPESWSPPAGHFTIGSTKSEVESIQGKPERIGSNPEVYWFGASSVTFENGKVIKYSDVQRNLKAYFRK